MAREGYIKLHREVLDSYLWTMPPEQMSVALTCLLLANWRDGSVWSGGRKIQIPRGSFMTSIEKLAKAARVSQKTTRTSLKNLEKAEFLASQSTNRHRIISITNYESYQSRDDEPGKPSGKPEASHGQAAGKPWATNEEGKKGRREEEGGGCSGQPALSLVPGEPEQSLAAKARDFAKAGIDELNHLKRSSYSPTSSKLLENCRILAKEGYTPDDARIVVRHKVREWLGDRRIEYALRPKTLFRPSNFRDYIDEARAEQKPTQSTAPIWGEEPDFGDHAPAAEDL